MATYATEPRIFRCSETASAGVGPPVIRVIWVVVLTIRLLGRWRRLWCIGRWIRWRRRRDESRRIRRTAETGRRIRRDTHCRRGYREKHPRYGDLPDAAAYAG